MRASVILVHGSTNFGNNLFDESDFRSFCILVAAPNPLQFMQQCNVLTPSIERCPVHGVDFLRNRKVPQEIFSKQVVNFRRCAMLSMIVDWDNSLVVTKSKIQFMQTPIPKK
eukprot:CAMPEP_0194064100 /NCGR_PEP_ID=MMETSP0009_2-20130614/82147_1 /TAXON_ID=210454 /ORGANISM="Grammatophora oceanica, Strain CCMP 410" /LENGTH=111 /DNA_ID=CAMNT_0038716473 /DNA_START=701 /DNA_END=1033 /DNA_ORIENTATION=-